MQLFFRELGQGNPLIILHGLFGSCDNWLTVSKPLAENFKVFLVDQRNHGRSPHDTIHTYESMAEDLLEFFSAHKIENPIVLGHSMGGKTAMFLALHYPEVLQKLVVVDIAPCYYAPHHQAVISALQAVNLDTLSSREQADKIMTGFLPDLATRQFLLKNLYRNDSGGFAWRMNLYGIVNQIENIGEESHGKTFLKPTLFIKGQNSTYIQEKDHKQMFELFPNAQLRTLKGAGHWVQAEKPKEFVEEVLGFLV
ncbi:MAG TPA: alpha/beta hydrolase [Cytophagales bacterium]|jgi:esterase|nr:alpha/beta hydrolase [Cytophagales bacterium]